MTHLWDRRNEILENKDLYVEILLKVQAYCELGQRETAYCSHAFVNALLESLVSCVENVLVVEALCRAEAGHGLIQSISARSAFVSTHSRSPVPAEDDDIRLNLISLERVLRPPTSSKSLRTLILSAVSYPQMIPLFGEDRRRRDINLGGRSSSTSQVSILNEAKARREERQDYKRRQKNAVRIQAWWRGLREAQTVRQELRKTFEHNVTGITGLRCLVLIGQDEHALAQWSTAMISAGEGTVHAPISDVHSTFSCIELLLAPATGSDQASWFVLIKRISIFLLRSIASEPQSVLLLKCSSTDRLNTLEVAECDGSSPNSANPYIIYSSHSCSWSSWFRAVRHYGAFSTLE